MRHSRSLLKDEVGANCLCSRETMKIFIKSGALIAVLLSCAVALADDVDDYVNGFIRRHKIPAAAIAVVKTGKVVKTAGYGTANLELNVPASSQSIFEIGSISKQFGAEVVMMLVEAGKL